MSVVGGEDDCWKRTTDNGQLRTLPERKNHAENQNQGHMATRGEYLADCCGLTAVQFAAGIDSAMSGNRSNIAAKPATGERTGAGTRKTRTKRKARATVSAQPAGAAQ